MKAKGYSRKAIVVFCLLVFAFFFSLQDVTSIFSHRVNYSDSGVYQYIGSSLLRGEVLYRDNFDHFGPVLYIINALGFAIAKIHGVWLIDFLAMFIIELLGYKITEHFLKEKLALIVSVSVLSGLSWAFWIGNTPDYLGLAFILGFVYCSIDLYIEKELSKTRLALLGLLFTLVFWTKQALVFGIFLFYIWGVIQYWKKNKKLMLTQIFIPSGVWAVLSGIILVWLKGVHGAYDMIQQYFKFTWHGFKVDVLHSHIFGTFWFFFNRPDILLLFYFIIVYIVIEVFSRESKESKEKDLLKIVLVILVLQMFFVALPGRKYVQYSSVYYVWLLLAYTLIVQRVVKGSIKIVTAVLVFILLVPNGVIAYRSQVSNWKDVGKSQETVAFLRENTAEGSKIAVASPDHAGYYLASKRNSATKYPYIHPSMFDHEDGIWKEYQKELEEKNAEAIVWFDQQDIHRYLPNIENNYQSAYTGDGVTIYLRK